MTKLRPIGMNVKKQKLLVIAPHPDDEVIGCAGLIQRVKKEGGQVYVLFLTNGTTRDYSKYKKSTESGRLKEIEKVAKFLKFDNYTVLFTGNEYHLKLDQVGQHNLMNFIERDTILSFEKIKPSIIAFPSLFSYNQDHKVAAYSTHASLRPGDPTFKHAISTVLSYESPADAWTLEHRNEVNCFVPLTKEEMTNKLKALSLYKSQMRKPPNPRSLEALKALCVLRGSMSGSLYAEAFSIHKTIV